MYLFSHPDPYESIVRSEIPGPNYEILQATYHECDVSIIAVKRIWYVKFIVTVWFPTSPLSGTTYGLS